MHRSLSITLLVGTVLTHASRAESPPAVTDARDRLARADARGAVDALEAALPGAEAEVRRALLDALRDAYPAAATQADAEGKADDAGGYRENLEILNRAARPAAPAGTPAPGPAPVPSPETRPAPAPSPEPAPADVLIPLPDPDAARGNAPPGRSVEPADPSRPLPPLPPAATLDAAPALAAPEAPAAGPAPAPAVTPAAETPVEAKAARLRTADAAFVAERYDEAGRIYSALNRDGVLPADRRGHWSYCRAVDVVRRINARPAGAGEWASIDAEIQKIRALSPSNWFAEYLRNLAAERHQTPQPSGPKSNRSNKVVVRGSSPEESAPAPARPGQNPQSRVAWSREPLETANFVVVHVDRDRALAAEAAKAAEAAREASVRRWGAPAGAWSPKCEIVIFPSAADFSRETLQPPDSPGFSSMGMNAGRIVLRRVHLRADHPTMARAILPHEVTHVVLADLFPTQQVPRWADEGMAVLAEPLAEQSVRAADLDEPLRSGQLFRVGDLMAMDYPRPEFWALYYAQSVSLTRFLVETGDAGQFVKFVQLAQRGGVEPALKSVYAIANFDDLHARWLAYARDKTASLTASSSAPGALRR